MNRDSGGRKTALVTGASSGIGLELARLFASDGYDLVLVARSEAKLRELAAEMQDRHAARCTVLPVDLSQPGAAAEIARAVEQRDLRVDALVNDAGFGLFGNFTETDLECELRMIQVNVTALTELTKRFVPAMVARRRGEILNVASTAAFQPGPLMAVYYATKAYVLSFSEALANELQGTGVTVTALCPGPTRSAFQSRAQLDTSRLFFGKSLPDSAQVARAGYRALKSGRRVFIPGMGNWILAQCVRFLPRAAVTAIVRRHQERVRL